MPAKEARAESSAVALLRTATLASTRPRCSRPCRISETGAPAGSTPPRGTRLRRPFIYVQPGAHAAENRSRSTQSHNARVRPRPGLDVARAVLAGGPVCRQRTRRQLTEQLAPRARVRVARREYNSVGSRCRRYVEIQPAPPSRCERSWCDCGHILRQPGWWRRITAAPVLALKSGIS